MKQFLICFAILYSVNVMAQNKVDNQLMSWWNLNVEYSLSDKMSISSLYSWRRADVIENWQQSLLRIGANYKATSSLNLTLGYDWVITFPYGKLPIDKKFTEHRIFEQIILKQNVWKFTVKHRYRFEQRFFNNTNNIKHRFRYRLGLSLPIDKNKWALQVFDELFVNYGPNTNNHTFDQNWIYGGFLYKLKPNLGIKLGYMNQYILKSDTTKSENNPSIQLGLSLKFDK